MSNSNSQAKVTTGSAAPPLPSPPPTWMSSLPEEVIVPGPKNRRIVRFTLASAALASMACILSGYDIGVMSGAVLFIKKDLKISDTQEEILLGILNLYSLVGSFAAGRTSDWIGRRCTIVFAAAIFFVGALLMGLAPSYAILMLGRFVAGVGVGYAAMIAPVYTAEVSPASSRGFLTSFPEGPAVRHLHSRRLAGFGSPYTETGFSNSGRDRFYRVGRRPLLLSSTGGMMASLAALGLGLTVIGHRTDGTVPWAVGLSIASVLAYVAFFSIGLGPITWVYSSEIFPLRLRAQGCAMGVAVNRTTSGVITMTFISLYKAISIGGSFFLYGGIAAVAWVFFFTYLPETRGRTLEETEKLFGIVDMDNDVVVDELPRREPAGVEKSGAIQLTNNNSAADTGTNGQLPKV